MPTKRSTIACPNNCSQHQLQLAERLGFGIHGIIFVAEGKSTAGKTALKVHRSRSVEPYLREREVYERLRDAGVSEIFLQDLCRLSL